MNKNSTEAFIDDYVDSSSDFNLPEIQEKQSISALPFKQSGLAEIQNSTPPITIKKKKTKSPYTSINNRLKSKSSRKERIRQKKRQKKK